MPFCVGQSDVSGRADRNHRRRQCVTPQGWEAVEKMVAKRARLIAVEQRGAGPARNGAVASSNGEILAFVDSDCRPDPEWIEQGLAALAKYDIVGGRVDVLVQNPDRISAAEAFERVFAFNIEDYLTRKGFVGSGNLFCNRNVFDRVGGFGTGLSEDVDWSHRAAALHFTIGYAPRAIVGHPARRSWAELRKKWFRINAETYSLKKCAATTAPHSGCWLACDCRCLRSRIRPG